MNKNAKTSQDLASLEDAIAGAAANDPNVGAGMIMEDTPAIAKIEGHREDASITDNELRRAKIIHGIGAASGLGGVAAELALGKKFPVAKQIGIGMQTAGMGGMVFGIGSGMAAHRISNAIANNAKPETDMLHQDISRLKTYEDSLKAEKKAAEEYLTLLEEEHQATIELLGMAKEAFGIEFEEEKVAEDSKDKDNKDGKDEKDEKDKKDKKDEKDDDGHKDDHDKNDKDDKWEEKKAGLAEQVYEIISEAAADILEELCKEASEEEAQMYAQAVTDVATDVYKEFL